MLKQLQKAMGMKPKAEGDGLATEMTLKLDTTEVQAMIDEAVASMTAEFESYKQTAEALVAAADEKAALVAAELADMAGKLVEAQAALAAATEGQAKAAADALAAKLQARKEKLVASLGTERADAVLKVTEGMNDAAFDAIVSALGVSAAVEAASPLFKEVGAEGAADASKVTEESAEMKILKKKYAKK